MYRMSLLSRRSVPGVLYERWASILVVSLFASLLFAFPAAGSTAQDQPLPSLRSDQLSLQLARPHPALEDEREAFDHLERAIEEWNGGDQRHGAYLADSAMTLLPALSDWRPLVLAQLLALTGDTAAVRSALGQLDPTGEYWSRWGWIFLADAYEEAGDLTAAREAARAQALVERNPGRASAAWLRAGTLALEAGDSVSAQEDLWAALEYGTTLDGAQNAALLIDQNPWPLEDTDELRLGRTLLASRAWEQSHMRLAPYVTEDRPPIPADRDELRLGLGRALFELRRFSEAEAMLSPLIRDEISSQLSTPALYWTGRALLERGAVSQAESILRQLAEVDSSSPWAELGLSALLSRELETGFGPRARQFLDELLQAGVASASIGARVVQLGSTQYLSQNYLAAARTFEQYLRGSRNSSRRQQAGYWAALSHERAGDESDARSRLAEVYKEDPLTFYGVFAGERIGAPVLPLDIPAGPPSLPGLDAELENALLRLRVHRLVPISGSFAYELSRLTDYFSQRPGGAYEFAEALIKGGFPLQAIVLGRSLREEEGRWNLRLLRIVHPFPHRDIIVREAGEHGLDPFFVAGLIRQESAYDAGIKSSSGAVGLMQLMPPTAREVAGNLGLTYSPDALTDAVTNLRLGTTYLASMMRRFNGKPADVLSAYNAGPSRMRRWQQHPTYQDRDVFLENIPFRETQNYAKVVQQYTRIYSALYGCGNFEPCLGLTYPTLVARSPFAGGTPRTDLTPN